MATERTADLILGAFQDEMVTRRPFDVKDSKGKVVMTFTSNLLQDMQE